MHIEFVVMFLFGLTDENCNGSWVSKGKMWTEKSIGDEWTMKMKEDGMDGKLRMVNFSFLFTFSFSSSIFHIFFLQIFCISFQIWNTSRRPAICVYFSHKLNRVVDFYDLCFHYVLCGSWIQISNLFRSGNINLLFFSDFISNIQKKNYKNRDLSAYSTDEGFFKIS